MAYTKQTWQSGDIVTSAKLNHMEDGIASGGVMVVNPTVDESAGTVTFDKTWQEIYNAIASGKVVIATDNNDDLMFSSIALCYAAERIGEDGGFYYHANTATFGGNNGVQISIFETTTPDGYPHMTIGG